MRTITQILLITAVGCLVSLPIILFGVSIWSADGATHARWYASFSEQLWAGQLYPRWLLDLNNGLGSPAFFYYPPIPFYITSILRPLFPGDVTGVHQVGVSCALSLVASGLCACLWLNQVTDRTSATMAAILYMITPYHLVMDLYVRSALAEMWAFAWMPLILYFIHKLAKGSGTAAMGIAISYALLVASHLPTTLMFSWIPLVYAIAAAETGRRVRTLTWAICSMVVGTGVAGIFLYPAMTTQSFVFVDRMVLGYFSYDRWFLFSELKGVDAEEKLRWIALAANLIVLAAGAFWVAFRAGTGRSFKRESIFWLAVALISFLMMTEVSSPIWAIVGPLKQLQFPWRFHIVLSVAMTALVALAISSARQRGWASTPELAITLFSVFVWVPVAAWGASSYFEPMEDPNDIATRQIEINTKRDMPEYRPRWSQTMAEMDWSPSRIGQWAFLEEEFVALLKRNGAEAPEHPRVQIMNGAGDVKILGWKPRDILLHVTSSSAMELRVLQFYYPGWEAGTANGPIDLEPSKPDGLLDLTVPAGDHDVSVKLVTTPAELVGRNISLVSICVLAIAGFALAFRERTRALYPARKRGEANGPNHV